MKEYRFYGWQNADVPTVNEEYKKVKEYWEDITGKVHVKTPVESMNILLNGWLIYQTISARLLARSGYYQSGGAFGFRDQLQDTIALKYINPEIMKNQIIKHSSHQFIEGDVEHWWHDETRKRHKNKIFRRFALACLYYRRIYKFYR